MDMDICNRFQAINYTIIEFEIETKRLNSKIPY